jgi:DNA-binding response OmpR family regulator
MKQIDIIRTYSQKRCLIVDDVPEARAQLMRILKDYGSTEVDSAGNAEEAIDLCEKRQYDIVIADYNLGQGKNGQQLLEELRFHKMLRNTSLFIMITAENASHDVILALENSPDDFLHKPISRDSLRPRLDNALLKSEHLVSIKQALDERNLDKAISRAEKLVQQPHKFQSEARKVLAELYLKAKLPDSALSIYSQLPEDRLPLWADLGMAKVEYLQKKYAEAESRLTSIVRDNAYCVEAQDLLAQIFELTHRPAQGQHALIQAVKVSPRSVNRQRELGRISLTVEDENTSVHAYKSAIKHAKNSCHEAPEDLVNLAEGLVKLSKKSDKDTARSLIKEAQTTLSSAEKKLSKNPIAQMRNKLVEAEMLDRLEKTDQANQACKDALELHRNMKYRVIGNTSIQLCIDCAKSFMDRGFSDEGEAILTELALINEDDALALRIDKLRRVPQTKEGIAYAAKRNKEGIGFYEKQDLEAAILSFRDVLRDLPNHIGLNLNLIQAYISKDKNSALDANERNQLEVCFQRIGEVSDTAPHFKRYAYLLKRFEKLASAKTD